MILTHHERFNGEWEGCGVEEDLALVGQMGDDAVEHSLEVLRQQLVGLQHNTTRFNYSHFPKLPNSVKLIHTRYTTIGTHYFVKPLHDKLITRQLS